MKIIFYSNQLCERGTETALIDYGIANKRILNNETIFAFPKAGIIDKNRYEMLKKDFTVFTFSEKEELVKFYRDNKIDLIYIIVDGSAKDLADELEDYQDIKTFVHCVFSTARKHGTYYCTIHNFLNIYFHTNYPVLPHIVNKLPDIQDDLRKELSIPQDAYVFGGYGGKPSFDIGYVHDSIKDIAETHEEIYFVFLNFEDFMKQKFNTSLKNVIFLPGTTDSSYKRRFINTCDSMLHARSNGETFGLSIAEFSVCNKPVISYIPSKKIIKKQVTDMLKNCVSKRKIDPVYSYSHIMNMGTHIKLFWNKKRFEKLILSISIRRGGIAKDCFSKKFNAEKIIKNFSRIIRNY